MTETGDPLATRGEAKPLSRSSGCSACVRRASGAASPSAAAAIAAGAAAMRDRAHVAQAVEHNEVWRDWLTKELTALGLRVTPSVGNFILVHFPGGKHTGEAADAFLVGRGFILRRVAAYGFPNALRMSIGSEEANRGAVAALAEFLRS